LICGVIVWLLVKNIATPTEEFSFLRAVIQWARAKSPLNYLHG